MRTEAGSYGRGLRVLGFAAVVAGCAMTRTIVDKINAEPLSPAPFHQQLTSKQQCMHCHTQIATAPAVPHPDYKNCAACHSAAP